MNMTDSSAQVNAVAAAVGIAGFRGIAQRVRHVSPQLVIVGCVEACVCLVHESVASACVCVCACRLVVCVCMHM